MDSIRVGLKKHLFVDSGLLKLIVLTHGVKSSIIPALFLCSRNPRGGDVRHQAGDHPADPLRGQDGHPGRGAPGAQDPPQRRVRPLRGLHRLALSADNTGQIYGFTLF